MWLDAWLATQLPAWLSGCWACCGPPTPFRTFPSCACRPQWTLAATGTPAGRADEAGAQAGKSGALTSQTVGTSLLRVAWGCPQAHLSLWEAAGGQAGAISVSAQTHGGGSGLCQARGSLGTERRKPNSEGAQWPASHTSPLRCRPENQTLRRRREPCSPAPRLSKENTPRPPARSCRDSLSQVAPAGGSDPRGSSAGPGQDPPERSQQSSATVPCSVPQNPRGLRGLKFGAAGHQR